MTLVYSKTDFILTDNIYLHLRQSIMSCKLPLGEKFDAAGDRECIEHWQRQVHNGRGKSTGVKTLGPTTG
jgi:hypothetical protein